MPPAHWDWWGIHAIVCIFIFILFLSVIVILIVILIVADIFNDDALT